MPQEVDCVVVHALAYEANHWVMLVDRLADAVEMSLSDAGQTVDNISIIMLERERESDGGYLLGLPWDVHHEQQNSSSEIAAEDVDTSCEVTNAEHAVFHVIVLVFCFTVCGPTQHVREDS